ncbi:MAG: hypothetical protein JKY37_20680 [Nannocystaceae bacterium]|nr:hypothetical protein [Nannocystaceae bacterium]
MDDVVGRVQAVLRTAIHAGEPPTVAATASSLATSERSLQRSLAREGARFHDVLETVRAAEDTRFRAQGLAPAEVAQRLGFSSANAYYRARARWRAT